MRTKIMITTLLAASLMLSCNSKELLEPTLDFPAFVVIDGDTVKTRDDNGKVYQLKNRNLIVNGETVVVPNYRKIPKKNPDKVSIDKLKNAIDDPDLKGKPLRVVATGFSGSHSYSYNNESIDFSVSNLIATQMGVDFYNPYFDPEDYNGLYTYVPSDLNPTGGPLPKFKVAKNNLAITAIDKNGKLIPKKLKIGRIDNFVDGTGGDYNMSDNHYSLSLNYPRFESQIPYDQRVLKEKFDFLIDISWNNDRIMEKGFTDYIPRKVESLLPGNIPNQLPNAKLDFFSDIAKRKYLKGILINNKITVGIPDEIVSVEQVRKELEKYQKGNLLSTRAKRMIPNPSIDSLLGSKVNMNMKPYIRNNEQILSFYTFSSSEVRENYEKPKISKLAEQLNWPELDVNFLFNKIYDNQYVTHDGYKINIYQLFEKNLGSNSKLTNIIIANEAIKLINSYYKTNFPYISTKDFLN